MHTQNEYTIYLDKNWKYIETVDDTGHKTINADKSLARPGRKQATATKLYLLQATQKKIQKVVRPTRSPRQQWPPRRTKNGDLSIVFSVGSD